LGDVAVGKPQLKYWLERMLIFVAYNGRSLEVAVEPTTKYGSYHEHLSTEHLVPEIIPASGEGRR